MNLKDYVDYRLTNAIFDKTAGRKKTPPATPSKAPIPFPGRKRTPRAKAAATPPPPPPNVVYGNPKSRLTTWLQGKVKNIPGLGKYIWQKLLQQRSAAPLKRALPTVSNYPKSVASLATGVAGASGLGLYLATPKWNETMGEYLLNPDEGTIMAGVQGADRSYIPASFGVDVPETTAALRNQLWELYGKNADPAITKKLLRTNKLPE
jgi:hypothetical protein